ncbi:MAG TPA: hypothetical protein VLD67_22330 [Vicinamibacterales bacterium]|nr:hypothetical protein [Vicinamibacterales bacterium]
MTLLTPRRSVVAAVVCAAASCGIPSPPTQPSGVQELEIRGTTLLMVGAQGRLTAWQAADGQLREVQATWTADGDAISIASNGVVTGRRLGQAIIRAGYRDVAGSATVHVVTSVAGTWRGTITVLDCWQPVESSPGPCQGRRGMAAPLVLQVSQSATADLYDNLRATVEVFTPPATGSFIGALDSSGLFILEGHVERPGDSLGGAVKLRWQLEGERLVPFTVNGQIEDTIDVLLSVGTGSNATLFREIWRLSSMTS